MSKNIQFKTVLFYWLSVFLAMFAFLLFIKLSYFLLLLLFPIVPEWAVFVSLLLFLLSLLVAWFLIDLFGDNNE